MAYSTLDVVATDDANTPERANQVRDNLEFLANPPLCVAKRTSVQAITSGVATAVLFDGEDEDAYGMHSTTVNPDRVTVPIASLYVVTAQVSISTGVGTYLDVRKNGTSVGIDTAKPDSTNDWTVTTRPIRCAANDYFQAFVAHSAGSDRNVSYTPDRSPYLSVRWVGF